MTAGRVLKGIEFAHHAGSGPLLLDLYLPADTGDAGGLPAIVHYHGGGWRTGGRSSLGPSVDALGLSPIEQLVDAGFVVASADYRLSSVAHFPAQLLDAKAAVRWLRTHAADYNVDVDRIYAWGDSAGGHLASLVGLTTGSPKHRGDAEEVDGPTGVSDTVAAVAAWYPPTDLLRMGQQALPDAVSRASDPGSREELMVGAVLAAEPEKAAAASPISYVSPGAPPFLLVHGTADRFVPAVQSQSLAAELETAGADVELLLIDDADHMWALPDASPAAAEKALAATVSFFRQQSGLP